MIRLWNSTEATFRGNKWVLNETTKSNITEVVNGEFALDLEHPLKDSKDLSKNLLRGNIITCKVMDSRPEQQFRIRKVDKTSSGVVVYAQSKLIADLSSNYIRPITLTGLNRKQAIQAVLNAALEPHSYTVGNLDTNTSNSVVLSIAEGTVLNALIGKENSILSEYGGEFIINNNTFDIVDSRGANRKFKISYGKNIASIKESIDDTDLATVLIPKSGDYRLPEYVVTSPKVANYEKRYFQEVDMNLNIWDGTDTKKDDQITLAEAYALMRTTCSNMFFKDKVDQVAFNYAIDLILLRKTEEYKHYNIIEKVYLGDNVTVNHKLLNVDLEGKVNKTVYNVLLDKYSNVEIGFTKQDITDIIKIAVKSIKFTKDEILLSVNNSISGVNASLDLQAEKIAAVVQSAGVGMGWTLNQVAFIVACLGASGANVAIDAVGLTVNNGKIFVKNSSGDIVFQVNTDGVCNAVGGFVVEDGDTSCTINAEGMCMIDSNNKKANIQILNDDTHSGVYIPDDLFVEDYFQVGRAANFKGEVFISGITIQDYIFNVIESAVKADSLK